MRSVDREPVDISEMLEELVRSYKGFRDHGLEVRWENPARAADGGSRNSNHSCGAATTRELDQGKKESLTSGPSLNSAAGGFGGATGKSPNQVSSQVNTIFGIFPS